MKVPYILDGRAPFTGALNFSHLLDAPAGKHGFVRPCRGKLCFTNGERIRFFGTNLSGGACVPDKDAADAFAGRIASMGLNMVRLHYADSHSQRGGLIDYSRGTSRHLSPDALDRLDYLVYRLKEEGIYIHLDLFVGRTFLPGDELDYPDDLTQGPLKHINIHNRKLIQLQKEYAKAYLHHKNPYTGLRYADEPAVAVVQVMNENSIFWAPDYERHPSYVREMDERFNHWLLAKYGCREYLADAWTDADGHCALGSDEDPACLSVLRPKLRGGGQAPLQFGGVEPVRYADHVEFLTGVQLDFSREMTDYLRALGVKCAINVSNHSQGPADNQGITTYEDVSEDNAYWNHPMKGHTPPCPMHKDIMVECDPRETMVHPFRLNLLTRLALNRMADRAFIVTEWNNCYPTEFSSDAMLMLTCYAALNDWDGLLLYSYSHSPHIDEHTGEAIRGFFNAYNDPSHIAQIGAAATMFYKGLISRAEKTVDLCYTPQDALMLDEHWIAPYGTLPYVSNTRTRLIQRRYAADADAAIAGGMTPTGDYRDADAALVYSRARCADAAGKSDTMRVFRALHEGKLSDEDMDGDFGAFSRAVDESLKGQGVWGADVGLLGDAALRSDTGELTFDFAAGRFYAASGRFAGFVGRPEAELTLGPLKLRLGDARMAVCLCPLDEKPLLESRRLLLSAVGACGNTGMRWEGHTLIDEGEAPVLAELMEGELLLPANCTVFPLWPGGERGAPLTAKNGVWRLGGAAAHYEILFS